eukprot:323801-Chlamydomonas_euryale.AAC.5
MAGRNSGKGRRVGGTASAARSAARHTGKAPCLAYLRCPRPACPTHLCQVIEEQWEGKEGAVGRPGRTR